MLVPPPEALSAFGIDPLVREEQWEFLMGFIEEIASCEGSSPPEGQGEAMRACEASAPSGANGTAGPGYPGVLDFR
ncbi:MAG: hypothetical protein LBW85_07370 [Deltaproteobacteria bacterium]|jgi:hypothetical protein|nr:hypothetical protein [Deltaproteobacteria bacterium]